MDADGYLYFIERRDEMIKTSGYRVSPTEIEEVIYATGYVAEAVACGVPHPAMGQAIAAIVTLKDDSRIDADVLLNACKQHLPAYMLPSHIEIREHCLPRNPNGKVDRKFLSRQLQQLFDGSQ